MSNSNNNPFFQSLEFLIEKLVKTTPFKYYSITLFGQDQENVIATNIPNVKKNYSIPHNFLTPTDMSGCVKGLAQIRRFISGEEIRFTHFVPIYDSDNKTIASLNVYDEKLHRLTPEQNEILEKAAQQASICLGYKQQEMELNMLDNLFTLSNDLIGIHDLDGNFLKINPAFTRALGWSKEDFLTQPFSTYLHPDDVEMTMKEMTLMQEGKQIINLTNRYLTKNNKIVWMEWTSVYDQKSEQVHTIGREVTKFVNQKMELKREEQKYRNLFEKIEGILTVHDTSGILREINPAGLRAIGYQNEKEVKGKNIFDFVVREDRDLITQHIMELKEKGHAISEMDILKRNQERATWYFISTISEDRKGVKQVLTNALDVTEQRKLAQKYKVAKEAAEDAYRIKSEFVANMSHEIRTPLNAIIGFTELSLLTDLNDTQKQYLEIINQSGKALYSIINDILDFSKMNSNKLQFSLDKVEVEEILSDVINMVSYDSWKKGIELLLDVDTNVPHYIWVDVIRLKQILLNLLSNALKFTDEGEILLYVKRIKEYDNNIGMLRFGVKDTGIGILDHKQQEIFKAFSQEDGSITKKYGGTGLGLTLSNKLLSKAGSSLQLISKKGEGSEFYFDVRFKMETKDQDIDLEGIKRVLIVDDNENNRRILRRMLEIKQVEVAEAENGLKALMAVLDETAFDVIIMDYHMPIMDGIETIRKIKQINPSSEREMPFIILYTSSDDESLQTACDELEIENRLIKPIRMQQMYRVLSELKRVKPKEDTEGQVEVEPEVEQEEVPDLKILVVEDNEINMLLTKTLLTNICPKIVIEEARDGEQAIEKYFEASPDIVLMDIQMPVLNGYEAVESIRANESNIEVPIIALTAHSFPGEKEKSLASGMNDFLTKPINQQKLESMLEKWLGTNFKNKQ